MERSDVYQVQPSRGRTALFLLGALLFVSMGLWLAFLLKRDTLGIALGWVCIVFFGLCAIGYGIELFSPRASLRLDDVGLTCRGHFHCDGLDLVVPWEALVRARIVSMNRNELVALDLADTESRLRRAKPAMRLLFRANAALVGTHFTLSPILYGISAEGLMDEINHRARNARSPLGADSQGSHLLSKE